MASEAKNIDHIAVQRINRWHYPVALSLIFLLIATALTVWLASTSSGARASFRLLDLITAGQIKAIHIGGSFMDKLQIGQLTVTTPEEKITINNLKLDWRPWALADRLLRIDRLHIGTLLIQTSRQTAKPLRQLPSSLLLPFDVMLDRCDIDTISIQQAYQKLVTAEDLELSWRFEKTAHVFRLQRAQMTQLGNIHTDSHLKAHLHLQASTPFSIQSDIQLQGTHKGWHLEATGHLGGVLSDIKTQMVVRLGQQQEQTQLSAQVQLQVLTPQIISAGELNAEQLDLSKINQDWPTTQMAVQIALSKNKKGKFSIHNALAGTWDKSRLPVTAASGHWSLQDDGIVFEDLHLNHDNLTGSIKIQRNKWTVFLQAKELNLKSIDSRLRTTNLKGNVHFFQTHESTHLYLALSEPWQPRSLEIKAEAFIKKSLLTVHSARLSLGDTVADISGNVLLSGRQTFDMRGDVKRLRLAALGNFSYLPKMTLTSHFHLTGRRNPDLQMALDFSVTDSSIGGHAINGEGKLRLDKNLLRISGLELRAGDNLLQANGELSEHHGELNLLLKASQLSQLGSSVGGQLTMRVNISGNLQQPKFIANWQGSHLRFTKKLSVRDTQGQLQLGGKLSSPLSLHAFFEDAVVSETSLSSVYIDLDGKPEQHRLSLGIADAQTRLQLSAIGGVDAMNTRAIWRGQLQQATMAGMIEAALTQSAAIALSKDTL